jgi:hypothetical protein
VGYDLHCMVIFKQCFHVLQCHGTKVQQRDMQVHDDVSAAHLTCPPPWQCYWYVHTAANQAPVSMTDGLLHIYLYNHVVPCVPYAALRPRAWCLTMYTGFFSHSPLSAYLGQAGLLSIHRPASGGPTYLGALPVISYGRNWSTAVHAWQ